MQMPHLVVPVKEASQVGEARRAAAKMADTTALNNADRGKVAIIVTELANNLVRHAGGGEILLVTRIDGECTGVEVIALDRGPGMADIDRCMQDGYSTGGTPGTGLGAVRRLSTEFDFFSAQPGGTVIVSRVSSCKPVGGKVQWSLIRVCAPGESECGDNLAIAEKDDMVSVVLADGLGHGPLAAVASNEALALFVEDPYVAPTAYLQAAHAPLRATRGAAIATARIDTVARKIRYAGAGNINGWVVSHADSRAMMSHNGTVGLELRKVQEFEYNWPPHTLIVMHSDGLQTRWSLGGYPGLLRRHPAVIAGVLYRDYKRGRDDATVLVMK